MYDLEKSPAPRWTCNKGSGVKGQGVWSIRNGTVTLKLSTLYESTVWRKGKMGQGKVSLSQDLGQQEGPDNPEDRHILEA